jgi:tetratricopeptide (TPR) repeat protein
MIALFSYPISRAWLQVKVMLLLLTALRMSVGAGWAQTSDTQAAVLSAHIARAMEYIHIAEQEHRPEAVQGALWAQLALEYHYGAQFQKAEEAYNKSLHLLKNAPSAREEYASTLESLASLYLIYNHVDEAERVRKQALAVREKLGSPGDIGFSHVHLANVAMARHQFKKAERLALRGMEEMESSSNPPRVGILTGLTTITYARCLRGHCSEGLISAQQAVAFANKNFEPESTALGFALETAGFAEWKNGEVQDAEKAMLHSIQILRTTLVPGDPRLAGSLQQYGDFLMATSRRVEAQEIHEEAERMTSKNGAFCSTCTVSVDSLSNALR